MSETEWGLSKVVSMQRDVNYSTMTHSAGLVLGMLCQETLKLHYVMCLYYHRQIKFSCSQITKDFHVMNYNPEWATTTRPTPLTKMLC